MIDFLGKELSVGDVVIFTRSQKSGGFVNTVLDKCVISAIREKTMVIESETGLRVKSPRFVVKLSEPKWHKFPEEKPTENKKYIVHTRNLTGLKFLEENVFSASYFEGDWLFKKDNDNIVTHWMEFPDAPTGDNNG